MKRRTFSYGGPLAINPSAYGQTFDVLAQGERLVSQGPIAIVRIVGAMTQFQEPYAGPLFQLPPDSYEAIVARGEAAFASEASAVVLEISSPGGMVAGVFEAAKALRAMADRSGKMLIAYLTGQCCSAAYALAAPADAIIASPATIVGSIGVIEPLLDLTAANEKAGVKIELIASGERKTDGNPHAAISDSARKAKQTTVDDLAGIFFRHVADHRGISVEDVQALQASVMVSEQALAAKLIDSVGTLEDVLSAASAPKTAAKAVAEDEKMNLEEAIKALKAAAEGDNKEEAARAKKMLAADESEEKEDESEAKAEDEEPEKKEDEPAAKAEDEPAAKAASFASEVTKILEQHEAKKAKQAAAAKADTEARAAIFATRPDLTAEQIKALSSTPTSALSAVVGLIPKGRTYTPPGAPAVPTLGQGQGGTEQESGSKVTALSEYASDLDRVFGINTARPAVTREGGKVTFSALGQIKS